MTAVEEIEAAIANLAELRDSRDYAELDGWLVEPRLGASGAIDDPGYSPLTNDDLIVTLHRTIDAQLAILANGLKTATFHSRIIDRLDGNVSIPVTHALLIARAINRTE